MKKLVMIMAASLALSGSAFAGWHGGVAFRFGGGHYGHWRDCDSFWGPLALGVGLGALFTYPFHCEREYYCSPYYDAWYSPAYPAYVYVPAQPSYTYTPSVAYSSPPVSAPPPPKAQIPAPAPASQAWVPASKGAGKWVPDPTPYSYQPDSAPRPATLAASPGVTRLTITHSTEGVPLYIVSH